VDNINTPSRIKTFIVALIFLGVAIFGSLASIMDYKGLLTKSDIITFSTKSSWFIWGSPLCMYFSLFLFKTVFSDNIELLKNKNKMALISKIGGICGFICVVGFIFTFFFSFYVDFKLKDENYITCAKSSWIAPNKYVKNISLCK
jgi:Na+/proline symporter